MRFNTGSVDGGLFGKAARRTRVVHAGDGLPAPVDADHPIHAEPPALRKSAAAMSSNVGVASGRRKLDVVPTLLPYDKSRHPLTVEAVEAADTEEAEGVTPPLAAADAAVPSIAFRRRTSAVASSNCACSRVARRRC